MEIEVHCLPSDYDVNVQGLQTFVAPNTSYIYELIVDELGNQLVDENGQSVYASLSPNHLTVSSILVNALPSDHTVNTE